jgi:hypothetical protein
MCSEVPSTRQALWNGRSRELVQRDALRAGVDQLDAWAVRDLEPGTDLDTALTELHHGLLEILDAVDEDRPLSLKMSSQQHRRRVGVQAHHRHPRPERLDREDQLATQAGGEMLDVPRYVAAWKVDELQAAEHGEQPNRDRSPRVHLSTSVGRLP